MNRGSSYAYNPGDLHVGRFNEAPIHESGKYRGCTALTGDATLLQ